MDSKVTLNLIKHWQTLCNDIVFADIAPLLLQNKIITISDYENITSQPERVKTESLLLVLLKKSEDILIKFGEALERDYAWIAEKIKEGFTQEHGRDETDATPTTHVDFSRTFTNYNTSEDEKNMCIDYSKLNTINRNHCLNNRIKNRDAVLERRKIVKSRVKNRLKPKVYNSEAVISSTTEFLKLKTNEEITNEVITVIRRCSLLSRRWTTIAHSLGLTDRVRDIRFEVVHYGEDLSMCIEHLIQNWLEMFPKTATLSKLIEVLRSENFNKVADELTEILHRKPATSNG